MMQPMPHTASPGMMMMPDMVVFTLFWIMVGVFLCYLAAVVIMLFLNRRRRSTRVVPPVPQPHDEYEGYWQGYQGLRPDSATYPESEESPSYAGDRQRQVPPAEMSILN